MASCVYVYICLFFDTITYSCVHVHVHVRAQKVVDVAREILMQSFDDDQFSLGFALDMLSTSDSTWRSVGKYTKKLEAAWDWVRRTYDVVDSRNDDGRGEASSHGGTYVRGKHLRSYRNPPTSYFAKDRTDVFTVVVPIHAHPPSHTNTRSNTNISDNRGDHMSFLHIRVHFLSQKTFPRSCNGRTDFHDVVIKHCYTTS
eukprot:m.75825 g.75825  ORF g.75825 m.75825 type:complete len:200 (-) comp11858_c0_seq1:915-1514(-)